MTSSVKKPSPTGEKKNLYSQRQTLPTIPSAFCADNRPRKPGACIESESFIQQVYPCSNDKECSVGSYCHSPQQAPSRCLACRRRKKRCHRDAMCCPGNRCHNCKSHQRCTIYKNVIVISIFGFPRSLKQAL